ncbi:MAG: hypothetical protein ACXVC6_10720 [Bacteroidia bacterium]
MKTLRIILAFLLFSAIALSQNIKDDPRRLLDSMRTEVLIPRLRKYVQQVEKLETQMKSVSQKRQLKEYAREIVKMSNNMEGQVASLYRDYGYPQSNFYFGMGMGPWGFYPGMAAMGYPGNYYYTDLPPVYYDIDKVKDFANNLRFFTWKRNVRRKEQFIEHELEILREETGMAEHPVSVR